jgi:hypothetical protein
MEAPICFIYTEMDNNINCNTKLNFIKLKGERKLHAIYFKIGITIAFVTTSIEAAIPSDHLSFYPITRNIRK